MPGGRGANALSCSRNRGSGALINMVVPGNSLTVGTGSSVPWITQFPAQLLAGGFSEFSFNPRGHAGFCTSDAGSIQATHLTNPPGDTTFSLQALIPSEIDPLYLSGAINFCFLQEVENDIYYGETGEQAYNNVPAYMLSKARRWEIQGLSMPLPRQNTGTKGPGVTSSGLAPPTVTASASPVGTYDEFDVTTSGVLGVGAFTWYRNGVVMATNVVTAASLMLGGITYTFGAGTYTAAAFVGDSNINTYVNTAGYEAERQDFIARVAVDPTFSGTIDVVFYDNECPQLLDPTNQYYYAADFVHLNFLGDGVFSSGLLRVMRGLFPTRIHYSLAHLPYPAPLNDFSVPGHQINAGTGLQATNGQTVNSARHTVAFENNFFSQAVDADAPTYVTSGIGGLPSLSFTPTLNMATSGPQSGFNRYSKIYVMQVSVGGLASQFSHDAIDVRFNAKDGTSSTTLYDFSVTGGIGSIKDAPLGSIVDNTPHVFTPRCQTTAASQFMNKDGVLVACTPNNGYTQDPPNGAGGGVLYLNGSSSGATALYAMVYESPVELTAQDFSEAEAYCIARWSL